MNCGTYTEPRGPAKHSLVPITGRHSGPAGYYDNYLVDNLSCVIVGVQATAAGMRALALTEYGLQNIIRMIARLGRQHS